MQNVRKIGICQIEALGIFYYVNTLDHVFHFLFNFSLCQVLTMYCPKS